MDQVIRYARNPEKTTEASRKKLHEIEGIVDYHDKNAAEMQAELNVIRDAANKISGGMEQELGTKNRERHAERRNETR